MDHYANQQLSPTAKRTRTSVGDPYETVSQQTNQKLNYTGCTRTLHTFKSLR